MIEDDIKDLSDEEYDKTYSEGEPHAIPEAILEEAIKEAKTLGAQEDSGE